MPVKKEKPKAYLFIHNPEKSFVSFGGLISKLDDVEIKTFAECHCLLSHIKEWHKIEFVYKKTVFTIEARYFQVVQNPPNFAIGFSAFRKEKDIPLNRLAKKFGVHQPDLFRWSLAIKVPVYTAMYKMYMGGLSPRYFFDYLKEDDLIKFLSAQTDGSDIKLISVKTKP